MADPKQGNIALRRARTALQRTQEQIVEDLAQEAERMHAAGEIDKRPSFSVRQYGKWEGASPPWPHPVARKVLEAVFGQSMAQLGFTSPYETGPTVHETVPFLASTDAPGTPPGVAPDVSAPLSDQPLPWLSYLGRSNGSGWRIGEAEVELLRNAADDMDAIDQRSGGDRLWRPTRAQLLWVHQMIDRGIYNEALERELHAICGKFTASLGWFCYDAGLQAEARYYFPEALNSANFTGDDSLASRTLSIMARQAVDIPNKGREAIRCARLGLFRAKDWSAPPRVMALLAIREAQGHARVGGRLRLLSKHPKCVAALGEGDRRKGPRLDHLPQ
ncbi:hypothetical protein [Streptomyces katsurahamanus]|uniref:XRE family transcriptional regulator n=1 Tax=Streptomyces katsurahamanus TaxID=2577098 RepID=A0ABW9NRQ5_9ACTN|nr:hypothetical protein [Streptomyces katsurahamanus]MQS35923.1 hypothetical protein [Streptomyces katsurahamanus]